jgi:hypothetical protein
VPLYPTVEVHSDDTGATVVLFDALGGREAHTVPQASKKHALRFAVGEPGRRGTVWRLWANTGVDDVYLASRHSAREMKISLHASGDWRYQIVQPEVPKTIRIVPIRDPLVGRVIHAWQRPEADAVGWRDTLTIVTPGDQLVRVPDDDVKITWCPAPGPGEQVELRLSIVEPNHGGVDFGNLREEMGAEVAYVGSVRLSGGLVALVLALTMPIPEDDAATVVKFDAHPTEALLRRAGMVAPSGMGARRLCLSAGEGSQPRFFDLSR